MELANNMKMRNFEYFNPRKSTNIEKYGLINMSADNHAIITDYHDVNMNVIRALKDVIGQVYFGGYHIRGGKNTPVEVRCYNDSENKNGKIIHSKKVSAFVLEIRHVLMIAYNNNTKTYTIAINKYGMFDKVYETGIDLNRVKYLLRINTMMACMC